MAGWCRRRGVVVATSWMGGNVSRGSGPVCLPFARAAGMHLPLAARLVHGLAWRGRRQEAGFPHAAWLGDIVSHSRRQEMGKGHVIGAAVMLVEVGDHVGHA